MNIQKVYIAAVVMFIGTIVFLSGHVYAGSSGLSGTIRSDDPLKPVLVLTNSSNEACQMVPTALGTVAVTKLLQNGKDITPTMVQTSFDDSPDVTLASQLHTLKPGESVDVPLRVQTYKSDHVLEVITWSPDAGSYGTVYKLDPKQPLKMELSYTVPLKVSSGAPICKTVFASNISTGLATIMWLTIVAWGVVGLIVIAVLIWLFIVIKRHKVIVSAIIGIGIAVGVFSHSTPAHAYFDAPAEAAGALAACTATLNANRDLTGPVLDVANDPSIRIEIIIVHDGHTETVQYGENYYRIYWDPDDTHRYAGTGGNADPCTSLYHELYHVMDLQNHTFSRDDCAGSGLETKEVMATRAQNLLRVRLGMPPRSHYGRTPLPSGDCRAPATPTCDGEHCADMNGDPHLRTFDGQRYDFQAIGEFIAARDSTGDFEIQERQQQWSDSRFVAIATVAAMKVHGDRVEIGMRDDAMTLTVNGNHKDYKDTTLPGGGKVTINPDAAVVTWPDGSEATIYPVGIYGIHLNINPASALYGKLEGLLGNADGNDKNDLHVRGKSPTIQPTFDQLYPVFSDSWRITDSTSLFTYDSGKNTASYTNHSFPDKRIVASDLPNYAAAKALCESFGVHAPATLEDCALDVAITGRPEFAKSASVTQSISASSSFHGTIWQVTVKNPGDTASVTFDGTAGEKVFVDLSKTDIPSQCGILTLNAPDGSQIANGCIINGSGYVDGTVLPQTGTYTISLKPYSDVTGSAQLKLIRISDISANLTVDGPSVTIGIDKPGEVARYGFTGSTGQHIFVDIPSSTLPSQCGGIQLLDPSGGEVKNGCIISGSGYIDTADLPVDGRYTVVVDPNAEAIGKVEVRLVQSTVQTGNISVGGSPEVAQLTKPGSISRLSFAGQAGQRVYVDLSDSTIPSECGLIQLHAPDDSVVASGCIINGSGNIDERGTVLPVTGIYTIVLDPGGTVIGNTTIKLH